MRASPSRVVFHFDELARLPTSAPSQPMGANGVVTWERPFYQPLP